MGIHDLPQSRRNPVSPREDQKTPPSCPPWPARCGDREPTPASHLHAFHHHQLLHQGLRLAGQVHGALEQDHRMDCGEASLVQLLRVHGQHGGDAEGTECRGQGGEGRGVGARGHVCPPTPKAFPPSLPQGHPKHGYLLMSVPHCSAWLRSWWLLRLARISPSFKRQCSMAVQEAGREKEMRRRMGS